MTVFLAEMNSITIYLPQSTLLLALLAFLGVLVVAKIALWVVGNLPFV